MDFVSLHHHTTYSFLDGFGLPEAHVRRAAELGMEALAITDHGNVSGHVKMEQAANKHNIKPIYGCELYCGPVEEDSRKQRKNHLTVLASNQEGYRNLLRVVSRGYAEGFYYEPTVSGAMLAEHSEGLIVLSGCTGSLLATSLIGGKNVEEGEASYARAKKVASRFKGSLGDAFYLEVQAFPELEATKRINKDYETLSKELNIPLVASLDAHYTEPSESEMQAILHNVRGGNRKTLEEQAQDWGYDVPLCPPVSDKAIYKRLRATGLSKSAAEQAIANSVEIAGRCEVTLPKLERLRWPGGSGTTWRKWLDDGWKFRKIGKKKNWREYKARLKYEMSIIEEKDFIDYFLVVSDVVKFAKDSGIPVGPARGSAAASLVCFLLRITEVDPLLFPSLVFERFIDITRQDLPDIDLDFDDDRRREIRDYLVSKYGAAQVGNICSFTTYKSKIALDDVARVFRIPGYEIDTVKELLLERSSGDLRASATIEDTIDQFDQVKAVFEKHPELNHAMQLEGQVRGMGVHAAGLVVANGPLTDVAAVYARKVNGIMTDVLSTDKYDSEYLNILKIDVLGLKNMGLIRLALLEIGMSLQELYDLPLDDEETIRGFQENDVVGIFQFDGRAMRSVNAELQPDNFKEICDVNALARPGPLHNNASAEYIDVKRGRKEPRRFHPLADAICHDTHGQIVYQEQILRIVREVGGFDWTHAAYIRKIISRKIGEQEFARQYDRFWEGAEKNGLDEESAKAIWGACITAGSYAFNAAHCVAYGMLAYWTMWLKRHHPQAFFCAALQKMKQKQLELLRDAVKHGIEILPPDPAISMMEWKSEGKTGLRAGLIEIPGIGKTVAPNIIDFREGLDHEIVWDDLKQIRGIGAKTIEKIRGFAEMDDPFEIHKLEKLLGSVRKQLVKGELDYMSNGRKVRLPFPTHTSLEVPYSRGKDVQVVWLGLINHRNLRDLFEVNFSRTGVALDPSEVKDPDLREWVILRGIDEGELLTITIDRWKYPRYKAMIWGMKLDHDLALIRGVKRGFQSRRAIYITDMWIISPDED